MSKLTSRDVAKENDLEYVRKFKNKSVPSGKLKGKNNFMLPPSNIIHFYPPNDGNGSSSIKWFKLTSQGQLVKIHDNRDSFIFIKNIEQILIDMAYLYIEYLFDDVAINPYEFCIHLDEEVKDKYYSKTASLVLTKKSIVSKAKDIELLKMCYLNEFLDHFIGWNFGAVITPNSELEKVLSELVNLAISSEIRQNASISSEADRKNRYSKTVKPYSWN